jgi:hypothetical protein
MASSVAPSSVFSGQHTVAFSQGRRNEVYVYQGYGARGLVYSPARGQWRQVGMKSPPEAPSILVDDAATPSYYVARIDIENRGSGYNKPPTVTIEGDAEKPAKARAAIANGSVSEIRMLEYGKGYASPPCVTLTDVDQGRGEGAEVEFEVQGTPAGGDPKTGIVYWEVEQKGSGLGVCRADLIVASQEVGGLTQQYLTGVASGGSGSGARVRLNLLGITYKKPGSPFASQPCEDGSLNASRPPDVEVESFGSGYGETDEVTVEVPYSNVLLNGVPQCGDGQTSACKLIIKGYPLGHPKCPDSSNLAALNPAKSVKITGVKVSKPGQYYLRKTGCVIRSDNDPKALWPTLTTESNCKGEITEVRDEGRKLIGSTVLFPPDGGEFDGGPARATAVIRPTLRGRYQCYYRYVNDQVPEEEGGPLYSNLSPVKEVDCGDGAAAMMWFAVSGNAQVIDHAGAAIELWRTTSNQATTLFRVAKLGGTGAFGSTRDDLSDWELSNPDREGFLAMPILLPNGELNANRFGVPPTNFAVGVMFQDRMWMGVDTSGKAPNTLLFSEADEPEAMPEINELILQSNLRSTDYVTALIPYAGALIVCQSRHCHRLTYVAQPLIDASVFLLAYRGCINQRCWDIYDGRVYAMDDQGVYSLDPQGNVESLTLGIDDLWTDKIDFSLREWFMVRADRRLNVLRVSVAIKGDGSTKFPTRQFVFSFEYKTWWEERYPAELTAATDCRTADGQVALVYGTSQGALRRLGSGLVDIADGSISAVTITDPGRGYRAPPRIRTLDGHGAAFEAGINSDGELTGIVVKCPGTRHVSTSLVIEPPPEGGRQAAAECTVFSGQLPVHWFYRSGAFEYSTDSRDPAEGTKQDRNCSVTYQPTKGECELRLQAYYNNAAYPRSNVVRRDRGVGFVHSDVVPAAVLNMAATPAQEAEAHGVARALFSGRVLSDMAGSDRHVSIALAGQQSAAGSVAIHVVDIHGVREG